MLMSSPYSVTEKKGNIPFGHHEEKKREAGCPLRQSGVEESKEREKYYRAADTCRKAEAEREAREETVPTTGETRHKVHNIQ